MDYTVKQITARDAKMFIHLHHYSHGSHNGPSPCFGLYNNNKILIGVCMFATPCSEAVRASVFGKEHKDRVTELHRLAIIDDTPKNTESWFVSRCFKLLKIIKPNIRGIVSFADPTEGHLGIIYQALNFYYYGRSGKTRFYRDSNGRLRHPRQNGVNIKVKEAEAMGWKSEMRLGKHRYVMLFGWKKYCKLKISKEYPRHE